MNVVVIPEDFRNDQYILKPLFTRLFQNIGVPSVTVWVCQDPLLGGIGEALKSERLSQIVERRQGWADIFILCVDRDGEVGRRQRLDQLENQFGPGFLAENAWEEIETWVLAGWTCQTNGVGPMYALKSRLRKAISSHLQRKADSLTL